VTVMWERTPYRTGGWFVDVAGIGRYLIKRSRPGVREFVLMLNGQRTKYRGTADELKVIVARIVSAREGSVA
jgi:hypothetical protein